MLVYVDERERESKVPKYLQAKGLTVVFKLLEVGDYVIANKVGIERKTSTDFVKSLIDGRLFDQAKRLSEAFERAVLLIEGGLSEALRYVKVRRNALLGAYVTLALDMGIAVLHSRNEEETAEVIKRVALRVTTGPPGAAAMVKRAAKPNTSSMQEWQLYVLQCFPHVGPVIAQRILKRFGSIHRFCNASLSELASIDGLSERKAAEIYQVIHAVSELCGEERASKSLVDYLKKEDSDS